MDAPANPPAANAAGGRLAVALAFVRANGPKLAFEVTVNFALPFAIYSLASPRMGQVPALIAAGGPPFLWSVVGFVRERKLDAISLVVLAGMVLSLAAFAGGGGVKVLQLRENLVSGLIALAFLGSAAIGRPLIYHLARAGARRRGQGHVVEALRDHAGFRRAMLTATLVWGFGLGAICTLNCTLVFALSIKQFLLVGGPISWAGIGALSAWSFWFVPRALRRALADADATGPA